MVRLAILLLIGATVCADETAEVALKRKAYEQIATGETELGRKSLREFIRFYPQSKHLAEVQLALGLSFDESADEIVERVTRLRKVAETYPAAWPGRRAKRMLKQSMRVFGRFAPYRSQVPRWSDLGRAILVERDFEGKSLFKIYQLDADALRKRMLAMPFERLAQPDLMADEFAELRDLLEEKEVDFSGGNAWLGPFELPGLYLLEETTLGTKTQHRLSVGGEDYYIKTLAGEAVLFTREPGSVWVRTQEGAKGYRTDAKGLLRFPITGPAHVFIEHDWIRITPTNPADQSRVYITTDRPVYRPGQTVHFKAVRRDLTGSRIALPPAGKVKVEVRDPRLRLMQATTMEWSGAGSLEGSFQLAAEPPLGTYIVVVHVPRADGEYDWLDYDEDDEFSKLWFRRFDVAAYRKPEVAVRVEFLDPKRAPEGKQGKQPKGKRKLRARIRAEYLFGGPVAGADVEWYVTGTDPERYGEPVEAYPSPPFPERDAWWRELYSDSDDDTWWEIDLDTGDGKTNDEGILEIEFEAEELEWGPARFHVHAEVRDSSNRTARGEALLEENDASGKLLVGADRMWYRKGDEATLTVRALRPDGTPAADETVELVAFAFVEYAGYESFFRKTLTTDANGFASCKTAMVRSGDIRLRASTKGGELDAIAQVGRANLAVGRGDWGVFLCPDRLMYRPGETIEVMIQTGADGPVLFTVESDRFHDVRLLELEKGIHVVEIEAAAEHVPTMVIKAIGFREGTSNSSGCEVFVVPHEKLLDVEVSADKPRYRPREKATISLDTGAPAELELAIVDAAVLELKEDETPSLLPFFFARRFNDPGLYGSFDEISDYSRPYRDEEEVEAMTPLFGGQAEEAPMAVAALRSRFPDTMYWAGSVRTGADGKASVEVEVPDSLTRWRVLARAVSGADRFGVGRSELLSRKNVVARISAPRFLMVGDEASVGVVVHNHLDAAQEFRVGLEGYGEARTVEIAAGGEKRLDWTVRAKEPGNLTLRASALSTVESDAMEVTLPVKSRLLALTDTASARVDDIWKRRIGAGELEIFVSSSHLAAVSDALPYLAGYPYGCVEQTMSRFLPAVVASRAMKRGGLKLARLEAELPKMVDAGLQRLYGYQHDDGGWGWWKTDDTNAWMTAYVVFGLVTAKRAGFAVDDRTIKSALEVLQKVEQDPFVAYARVLAGDKPKEWPDAESVEDRAYLALAGKQDVALPLEPPEKVGPEAIRRVALIVRALAKTRPADAAPLVDWLLANRRGGAWYSTLDTAYAVIALSALPVDRQATQAGVTLGGKPVALENGRAKRTLQAPAELAVRRTGGKPVYVSTARRYTGEATPRAHPAFSITRSIERLEDDEWVALKSGQEARIGDHLRIAVTLEAAAETEYVMLEAPLPAGVEPADPWSREEEDGWWGHLAARDDRIELASNWFIIGSYKTTLRIYPTTPGTYYVGPPSAFAMYDPDRAARGSSFVLKIR